jgi:2-polyprenyl-6-methoxyphenol hydroxylase-like FAD-dependent oxidoreductase
MAKTGEERACITDPARIVYRPVAPLLLPPPWFKGRVLVIGDAAHTCAPQLASGATIAIEDSIVLANLSSRRRSAGSGHCQGSESLTVFSRTDRTGRDYGIYAGHLTGR